MLLDTDVVVDVLRGHPPATAWLAGLGATRIGLPGLVAMELLQGCRDRAAQSRVEKELTRFSLHWPDRDDCERALRSFAAFRLGHGIGLLDVLIGETAVGLGEPLATFNRRHFAVIAVLATIQPY